MCGCVTFGHDCHMFCSEGLVERTRGSLFFFIRLLLFLQIFCLFVWVWCCHVRTYSNAGHTALLVSQNADFGLCSVFFMFRFDYY